MKKRTILTFLATLFLTSSAWCQLLPRGSLVMTFLGTVPVEELAEGMYIMTCADLDTLDCFSNYVKAVTELEGGILYLVELLMYPQVLGVVKDDSIWWRHE